jgi:ferrous iron transport protein A
VAKGPVGGEPLLVQVGFTRFALRISEAKRVVVDAASQERRA